MRTLPDDTMPAIEAHLAGGGEWRLAEEHPAKLALLVFYCGQHCPICRRWLGKLERLLPRFTEHGVSVIALSCDDREAAERARREWKLDALRIGYGIEPEDARKAGLYISEDDKGALRVEPAILVVKPEEGTLYAAWVQSQQHARPHFPEVLAAVESMLAHGMPRPRGGA
jgi:peroxiredoxin